MKKIKICLLALTVLVAATSFGQDDKKKASGTSFSVGLEAGLPIGDLKKLDASFGIGGSAKVGIPVFSGADVTISAGYISFMGKTVQGFKIPALGTIPVKAGLRFMLGSGFYGEPQLGYTIAKYSGIDGNLNGFTYAAGVGYKVSQVDVGVRYEAWSKSENGVSITPSFIGLRVAYNVMGN